MMNWCQSDSHFSIGNETEISCDKILHTVPRIKVKSVQVTLNNIPSFNSNANYFTEYFSFTIFLGEV